MRIESRLHYEGDLVRFEILDMGDAEERNEEVLAESLFLSDTYARESTAERNAAKWIERFKSASDTVRRKLCGYDTVAQCEVKKKKTPVHRRITSSPQEKK